MRIFDPSPLAHELNIFSGWLIENLMVCIGGQNVYVCDPLVTCRRCLNWIGSDRSQAGPELN